MEPFPEERENFLQQLYKFMEDRGEHKTGIDSRILMRQFSSIELVRNSVLY